ncbi:MAG: DeoR/GlpR transcriptional regulator [Chloroflexi bacterium]|nr:DeoR/GlpR transcriptional regulator [Chloroflexota bacterium]
MGVERRARIVDLARRQGAVRIDELSDLFQVSHVTLRNDLDVLARQGLLVRDRGGAIPNTQATLTVAFDRRAALNLEEKSRIGRAAASLVTAGDTIIMDAGTTLAEMARSLDGVSPLTVVTNALNVASQVGMLDRVHVILVGGSLNRDTISTIGPNAERNLGDLMVQKAFVGITGIEVEAGLTDTSLEVAQVKRAMMQAARQVILLADSSKWGHVDFARVAPLRAVQTLVTDSGLPSEARADVERLGIELILV